MSMTYKKVNVLGDYLNGKFVIPETVDGQIKDVSPSDLSDHICTMTYQLSHIDRAVEAAQKAYLPWASLTFEERKKYILRLKLLRKYSELLKTLKKTNDIYEFISLE